MKTGEFQMLFWEKLLRHRHLLNRDVSNALGSIIDWTSAAKDALLWSSAA